MTSTVKFCPQVTTLSHIMKTLPIGTIQTVGGFVASCRIGKAGGMIFITLRDGTSRLPLQIVVDKEKYHLDDPEKYEKLKFECTTGCSIRVIGSIIESPKSGQNIEMVPDLVEVCGKSDPDKYPFTKKSQTRDEISAHWPLRSRLLSEQAVLHLRDLAIHAVHLYYRSRDFIYLHTPVITKGDCEGAGEAIQVSTLLKEKRSQIPTKRLDTKGSDDKIDISLDSISEVEYGDDVDFTQDIFRRRAYLTVSGQLHGETVACGMQRIYTFGPTFRAEASHSYRHAAEFWMIEPEVAFISMKDNMDLAEECLQFVVRYVLEHGRDWLELADMDYQPWRNKFSTGLIDRLKSFVETPFLRITYTQAVKDLEATIAKGQKFEFPVVWGEDLKSEHEKFLTDMYGKTLIITHYPKDLKAFYMKQCDDGKTVEAFDILIGEIGEVVGGSMREEDLTKLETRIEELGMGKETLDFYLKIRQFGTVPHGGFGIGFARLLMFITGKTSIREVIPFPVMGGRLTC